MKMDSTHRFLDDRIIQFPKIISTLELLSIICTYFDIFFFQMKHSEILQKAFYSLTCTLKNALYMVSGRSIAPLIDVSEVLLTANQLHFS